MFSRKSIIAATHIFSPRDGAGRSGACRTPHVGRLPPLRQAGGRNRPRPVPQHVRRFDLLTNTLFSLDGQDKPRDLLEDIVGLLAEPNMSDLYPLLQVLDLQGLRHWTATHMNHVFHLLDKIIDNRLGGAKGRHHWDILDTLLALGTAGKLSRRDLKAMLFNILGGGHGDDQDHGGVQTQA
ncbi:hypothetical protein CFC21_096308 [Triticum aestivum]|uniref:Uncharacterized protein n=2 Tax=Triticum aestivum TaxID=4565 RepID=A0A3B6RE22_WHEAT|nr:hypothetical protein CFC21_096308 [Triticum aestivum]